MKPVDSKTLKIIKKVQKKIDEKIFLHSIYMDKFGYLFRISTPKEYAIFIRTDYV